MTIRCPRARTRQAQVLAIWLAALATVLWPWAAFAHEGHDHGAPQSAAGAPSPRAVATSESYQFVAIAEGEVLVVYLDRAADNEPVTGAKVEVSIDGAPIKAELQRNGTYEIVAPQLKKPGTYEVLASIIEGDRGDLLIGAITIPAADAHGGEAHTIWDHLPAWLQPTAGNGKGGLAGWSGLLGAVVAA